MMMSPRMSEKTKEEAPVPLRATPRARRYGRSAWLCGGLLVAFAHSGQTKLKEKTVIENLSAVCQSRLEQLVLIALSDGPGCLAQATKDAAIVFMVQIKI
jgi:hypothetical protein